MDDHIRTAEADRERVAARLREHYAEGRLSAEEFEERLAAALSATTFADLRQTLTDLPEPEAGPGPGGPQDAAGPGARAGRRHRRHQHGPRAGHPGWGGPGWPGPGWAGPGWAGPGWAGPGWASARRGGPGWRGPRSGRPFRRGPRILPLLIIVLILALIIPGLGWLFVAVLKVALVLWLVVMLAGAVALFRFRRHVRRWRQAWSGQDWQSDRRRWHQFD
jgi:uncharacterized protein DUF1707